MRCIHLQLDISHLLIQTVVQIAYGFKTPQSE